MSFKYLIATIDVTTGEVFKEDIPDTLRSQYIGGQGLASYLLLQHNPPHVDALSPDNRVIVSTGPLACTIGFSRASAFFTTKSPETGKLVCASLKGPWASEMRWAGCDHLVLQGLSPHPVYVYINKGIITLKNATRLQGLSSREMQTSIQQELNDEEIQVVTCGSADDSLACKEPIIRFSAQRTVDKTGPGKVLAAKNVIAIACKASEKVEIKDPKEALELGKKIINHLRGEYHGKETKEKTIWLDSEEEKFNETLLSQGTNDHTPASLLAWYKQILGCLGIAHDYLFLMHSEESVSQAQDFYNLIRLNLGNHITEKVLKEAAERSLNLEHEFNTREWVTPEPARKKQ